MNKPVKVLMIIGGLLFSLNTYAQKMEKEKNEVAKAVTALTKAMTDADKKVLTDLTMPNLTYGHSGGHVEGQQEFVDKIVGGKSDFVTIDITEQTVDITDNVAVVRHNLHAVTNDNNKPGEVSLKVLLIWIKEKKEWKLLARQAVKAK